MLKRDLLAIGGAGSGLGAKMGFCLVLVAICHTLVWLRVGCDVVLTI